MDSKYCKLFCVTGILVEKSKWCSIGGYKDPTGGYIAISEQGVVGGSKSDGFSESSVLRPHPGSLHDGTYDADQ